MIVTLWIFLVIVLGIVKSLMAGAAERALDKKDLNYPNAIWFILHGVEACLLIAQIYVIGRIFGWH